MIHIAGYFFSILIGFLLGILGGGGSILTIPVLVYFFGIDPVIATTYSLFIVGITAVSGSITNYRMNNIDYRTIVLFGTPSITVLFIVRKWLVNFIPSTIFKSGDFIITKSIFIMIIFSALMLICGLSMIKATTYSPSKKKQSLTRLIIQGCITGAVTGFIGIGGGFIIVPSLVLFAGLSIKKAIGTSLTIIIINCIVGLVSNLNAVQSVNFVFLLTFSALAILGILAGTRATRFIPDKRLKLFFGWIILAMSVIVFLKTL
jgi:uncharacterized membrane protein YfcA